MIARGSIRARDCLCAPDVAQDWRIAPDAILTPDDPETAASGLPSPATSRLLTITLWITAPLVALGLMALVAFVTICAEIRADCEYEHATELCGQ